jgi:transcription termination factor NusB
MEASPSEVLAEWRTAGREIPAYTVELVEGVERELGNIDGILATYSEEWTVPRMASVNPAP